MATIPRVIVLIERSRAFGMGLLRGVVQYANLHGPWLFCMEPEFYMEGRGLPCRWMADLHADGCIAHVWDSRLIQSIIKLGIPAVICGLRQPQSKACCIRADELAVGRMAAEYFIERGFRRFAYCGLDDMIWSRERGEGFVRAVGEGGFDARVYRHPRAKRLRTPEEEYPLIAEWLRSLETPIALMACNDDRSRAVLAACKIAHVEVPAEVAILGVDDDEFICGLSQPQLSSIVLSTERAGYEAARVVDSLMKGQPVAPADSQIPVSPLRVVTRPSTDFTAVDDPQVAEAVGFIRAHVREGIQVNDVANAVCLSRRALQQRFRKVLSRSVHSEIEQARVEQMTKLLAETNLSLSQIARLLGCPYANNLSRIFKQYKGISPAAFRRSVAPAWLPSSRWSQHGTTQGRT